MNEQLRKRIEEVARETSGCSTCMAHELGCEERCSTYFVAHRGAEHGYKEAVAEMTEWIETHGNISDNGDWHSIRLTELQAYMYKFLEEKK